MMRFRRLRTVIALAFIAVVMGSVHAGADPDSAAQTTVARTPVDLPPDMQPGTDPFLWLEQVHGAQALAWVESENAKTFAALDKDQNYQAFYDDTLAISQSKDRVPQPEIIGGEVYNFWRDDVHVRGILRRATLASYDSSSPDWTTVLDLDALARSENANWVYEGIDCPYPEETRCMVVLSDGGEDATTEREFDLSTSGFVAGGFALPHGKQSEAWQNADTLLVAREWSPGLLTTSGYPYVVKRLTRGEALADATTVFSGKPSDVGSSPFVLDDGSGNHVTMIVRNVSFFSSEYYLADANGTRQIALPDQVNIRGLVDGRLIVTLNESWTVAGATFPAGPASCFSSSALMRLASTSPTTAITALPTL